MKTKLLLLAFALPLAMSAQMARITVDTARVIGPIDPNIYGVFMEPIGFSGHGANANQRPVNTMYGTLYDPGSSFANKDGFDTRYIDAAKELQITNMRWPGGNYTADYHWKDGIGPKDKRPVLKELAWGFNDNNQVGTDEWIELNKAIGTENIMCINAGTGTLDEAAHWVEYCNLEPGSYYPDLRAKYGHPKPYGVKYWDLGNEVDGEPWIIGHKDAEDYIKFATEAAKIMKDVDDSLSFIISGSAYYAPDGKWVDWNRKVITGLRNIASYVSIHGYWDNSPNYYTYMGQGAMDIERKITTTADIISVIRSKYMMTKPIYIAFDEWAPFGKGLLPTLAMAQYFNSFIRHADVVKMSNYTMLTSILARSENGQLFKTPSFYTFKLFSNNCRGTSLNALVKCDTFSTGGYYKDIPYLDVTCVYNKNSGSLIFNVVNRHKEKPVSTELVSHSGNFAGEASVTEIDSHDLEAPYTFDKRDQYIPVTKKLKTKGNEFSYTFPAHSFTQIIVKLD
ncbi:alpha-L-arabinofuranosidase C-terminal domain-containing protein [Microbacter margulisiae]|uniref:non-reducing end alpha-L-arabinofuranosidase n=1 Tax=Microbacter margulisiae TaxID=1350067 RepID=A0A7W5DS69_9PORP|nr:alpha-L-arabinofuranosidase C-terminal domain-containing protein [Microbacter margulisiae]MBB3188095.1 alpha-N-arabinofuranosidase [Microbacter margulisiae]